MLRERRCEEVVTGNGHKYRLAGTFGNIEAVSLAVGDPSQLFVRLADGGMPPTDIKAVIACTLEEIDGQSARELDREAEAVRFLEDFGLQDCSLLARQLISHAIIGDVKKKQIDHSEAIQGLSKRFRLTSFVPRGWSWAAILIVSALPAYMIFR